jgi:NTP pyrophosphatase (non-canonical NTP hydrolase)
MFQDQDLAKYIKELSAKDKKDLSQRTLKAAEELGELAKVVLPYDNAFATTHRFADRDKITTELADTLLCLYSIQHSLNISDEELVEKLWKKSKFWDGLQARSETLTNIPFEIHITIDSLGVNRTDFAAICSTLNVKPLVLELHNRNGENQFDVQTSSFHKGTNRTAYEEMKRISQGLKRADFWVIREKIETVPWHPAAPQKSGEMPASCYFETHFVIAIEKRSYESLMESLTERFIPESFEYVVGFSKNQFKNIDEETIKLIVTGRSRMSAYWHREADSHVKHRISKTKARIIETMTEFAVYDTNVSHDDVWIKG